MRPLIEGGDEVAKALGLALPTWRKIALFEVRGAGAPLMWQGVMRDLSACETMLSAGDQVMGAWGSAMRASFPLRMAILNRMLLAPPSETSRWEAEADLISAMERSWLAWTGRCELPDDCVDPPEVLFHTGDGREIKICENGDTVQITCYNGEDVTTVVVPAEGSVEIVSEHLAGGRHE